MDCAEDVKRFESECCSNKNSLTMGIGKRIFYKQVCILFF